MKHNYKLIAMAACGMLMLAGCTGPKMVTSQPGFSKSMQPIPPNARLFIASTCDDSVADSVVRAKLARALSNTGRFASVEYGTATSDSLQLNIEIRAKRSLWKRRYNGDFSHVGASGELVSDRTTLVTLQEARSGAGGMFGAGGVFTCGEDRMVRVLTRWVIKDLADYLKQVRVAEK